MSSNHVIFVDQLIPGKGMQRASGILLGSTPTHAHNILPQWSSWILSAPQREISCQSYPKVVGHGANLATGEGVLFFDGEPVRSSSVIESTVRIASNPISFYVNEELSINHLPVFLASDSSLKPCRFSVRVRLHFDTLDMLPDIQAWAWYGDWIHDTMESSFNLLERLLFAGFQRTPATFGREFLSHAQAIRPEPGNRFPTEIRYNHQNVHGVLALEERNIDPNIFCATLYLSDTIASLSEGTHLFREVEWVQKRGRGRRCTQEAKRFNKQIATIESVLDWRPRIKE